MAKGVRVGGPLGPFRDGAEQALRALEYSEGRVGHLLLVMAHLSRWLDECGLGVADLTSEAVEQFFVTFRAHHRWCRSSRSLRPVLEHLGAIGVVPTAEVDPEQTTKEELLVSFAHTYTISGGSPNRPSRLIRTTPGSACERGGRRARSLPRNLAQPTLSPSSGRASTPCDHLRSGAWSRRCARCCAFFMRPAGPAVRSSGPCQRWRRGPGRCFRLPFPPTLPPG